MPDLEVDPFLVPIIGRALRAITDEMSLVMERTTRSPILCEAKDFVTGLYDAEGRMLEQTENLPILSFSLGPVCAHIARKFKGKVFPGDVFFHNDVFSLGNQNNDVAVFRPVFTHQAGGWRPEAGGQKRSSALPSASNLQPPASSLQPPTSSLQPPASSLQPQLIGWAAAKGHQADIGGAVRGGYNPAATEVWQEALRIPAVKVYEKGVLRRDVWDLIFANIRLDMVAADMRAQIGACTVGERRLQALVEKYGLARFELHKQALFEASRKMMQAEIRAIPNGVYHGESLVYYDGKNLGRRYTIRVAVTVEDERIRFDYSGTDAQTNGFVNGTYTSSASAALLTFLQMVNPDIPHNHGMIEPLEIIIPEGSILNASYPAATTYGNHLCPNNADAIMRALAPVIPDRVSAGWNHLLCSLSTGFDERRGDPYVDICFMGLKGGSGAVSGCDGYDHIGMIDASGGVLDQDYEMFEQMTPHLLEHHEYLTDSAGPGKFRGGLGVETRYQVGGRDTQIIVFGDGHEEGAFGLHGGQSGGLNALELHLPDGSVIKPLGLDMIKDVPAGTRYVQRASGGGGFGPPWERPAALVHREVLDEKISPEAAREHYGVVIDAATLALDEAATRNLRRAAASGSAPSA